MLSSLPLFPFMAINVTALARHPPAIDARNAAGRWQCRPVARQVGLADLADNPPKNSQGICRRPQKP
jgi:hypothetical protein